MVEASNDVGAAYHLAKQYEAKDDIKKAILYYQRAQRFNHAIRLARTHDLAGELNMMAISAPPKQMCEAAAYFESRGQEDRAVMLYQKGGNVSKAVELCFRSRLFDQLREIAETLSADADPVRACQPTAVWAWSSLTIPHTAPSLWLPSPLSHLSSLGRRSPRGVFYRRSSTVAPSSSSTTGSTRRRCASSRSRASTPRRSTCA